MPPNFQGKHHSEETKKRISEAKKANPTRYWLGKKRPGFSFYKAKRVITPCLECNTRFVSLKRRLAKFCSLYCRNKSSCQKRLPQLREYFKLYRKRNRRKINEINQRYRQRHREKVREVARIYCQRLERKAIAAKNIKSRRKKDPDLRIKGNLQSRIRAALRQNVKSASTVQLLGCSIEELKQWIANQFVSGMTWDNYGKWQIDHKKPCASFDLTDGKQQKECFHYTNLQPLWAKDNLFKSSKV